MNSKQGLAIVKYKAKDQVNHLEGKDLMPEA